MRIDSIPVSPVVALILLVVGVLLVYWELCRPGMVVPGVVGITLAILCAVKLRHVPRAALPGWALARAVAVLGSTTLVLGGAALAGFIRKRALALVLVASASSVQAQLNALR